MSDSEEFEVTAKPDSLTLKAKGGAAGRLAHQVADVLSPFSGFLGAAGDRIEQYRMLRREAAAAALLRARELKTNGGDKPHLISQKVLAPWLEGASTEDIDSENLLEVWARILAKSPEEFDASYLRYIEVTKNIGAKEAEFFQSFMGNYVSAQIPEGFFKDTGLGTKSHNRAASENSNFLHKFAEAIFEDDGDLRNSSNLRDLIAEINGLIIGQIVHFMSLDNRHKDDGPDDEDGIRVATWFNWDHPKQVEIEILRQVGLVKIDSLRDQVGINRKSNKKSDSGPVISIEVMQPTALGCSFYFGIIESGKEKEMKTLIDQWD